MNLKTSEFAFMEIKQSSFWCSNLEKCPDPPSNCHSLFQSLGPTLSCLTHCHQHSSHFRSDQWTLISNHPTVAGITASAVPGAWKDVDIFFTSLRWTDHEVHAVTNFRQAATAKGHSVLFSLTHQECDYLKDAVRLELRVKVSVTCAEITQSDLV